MPDKKDNTQQLVVAKKEAAQFLENPAIAEQVAKVLPKHITADRMLRVAQTMVMRTPKLLLAAAHPAGRLSLMNAILRCAQAGLETDGRNAHLVPYWNKDAGCYEVNCIFDWKGLVALGLRNGFESLYPDMVCANDIFEAWMEDGRRRLIHKIDWKKPRGEPYLWYCVSMLRGVLDYEIMTFEETEAIRKRSRASAEGPWVTDTNEMRKKCPIRRMSKRWDLLPEIKDVINADDDTPPPLGHPEPKVTAPIFNVKSEVAPAEPNPELAPSPEDAKELENLVSSITARCKESKLDFKVVAGFLFEMGVIDVALNEIREFPIDVLRTLDGQWDDIVKRINGET